MRIPASAADAAAVNPKGINTLLANGLITFFVTGNTLLANGLITFFINGNPVFNNQPSNLPKNPPD